MFLVDKRDVAADIERTFGRDYAVVNKLGKLSSEEFVS